MHIYLYLYRIVLLTGLLLGCSQTKSQNSYTGEDGYRTWLRYELVDNQQLLQAYKKQIQQVHLNTNSPTMQAVEEELLRGLTGLLGTKVENSLKLNSNGTLVLGTPENSPLLASLNFNEKLEQLGTEGFLIEEKNVEGHQCIVIAANTDLGVLYGTFHFLRMLQTQQNISDLELINEPQCKLRLANHWDNLDRSVERGYAGRSLWEWGTLPEYAHPRYTDYARISASVGINGVAINNVNADARFITSQFLEKIAMLADIFRPYGVKVYLAINYSSPVTLGGLKTADPLAPEVVNWWQKKTNEIYSRIPDFGGFLVKADSEGQPGPKTYGRNHAEGANMLANVIKPFGGIVVWRAFVYGERQADRVREAYDEFVPLDGKFADNVVLQIKNGPLDFMPREPFSPLFGALPQTNTMIEFQVTQEYLGNANHLLYKGRMFKELLDADTYAKGKGTTVAKVLSGEAYDYPISGMTAVVNPGTDRNWTRHPFVQSSWFAFGRLAWDYNSDAEQLAEQWIRQTFSNNEAVVETIKKIMLLSDEAGVNYREPLGLTHIGTGMHYGPAPWSNRSKRFHQADDYGIGFDRSENGSNAVEQYFPPLNEIYNDIDRVPEKYLLWFHHVSWNHQMKSGRTLWEELVHKYYDGVKAVRQMQQDWNSLEGRIDEQRFSHVKALLEIQEKDAVIWRNSCVLYFQTFSQKPIPAGLEKPEFDLDYYKQLEHRIYISE
ncbi:alpha-glucuronidase family glycosyl hydrolase [uncultured Draconibacterium sp.]|uniref:alpha-glucuronidase family glycosyl hydrolase n=1 Tax=uncultured Draconibacterium sp. TaxID=1573823 RepID=UPI0029C9021C|nr:alpha-glucuronidase family glycosyl hydrolase [uncultured Draconibacterium sp.]